MTATAGQGRASCGSGARRRSRKTPSVSCWNDGEETFARRDDSLLRHRALALRIRYRRISVPAVGRRRRARSSGLRSLAGASLDCFRHSVRCVRSIRRRRGKRRTLESGRGGRRRASADSRCRSGTSERSPLLKRPVPSGRHALNCKASGMDSGSRMSSGFDGSRSSVAQ